MAGLLAGHQVDYVIVGGVSALMWGAQRSTGDIDGVFAWNPDNLQRLANALNSARAEIRTSTGFSRPAGGVDVDELRRGGSMSFRTTFGHLDVLRYIPGGPDQSRVGYPELRSRAVPGRVSQTLIWIASLDDVIASKEAIDRPKDREALPELYELRRLITPQQAGGETTRQSRDEPHLRRGVDGPGT